MDDFVHADIITHLKIIFWPNLGVGSAFQALDILEYACGLNRNSERIPRCLRRGASNLAPP